MSNEHQFPILGCRGAQENPLRWSWRNAPAPVPLTEHLWVCWSMHHHMTSQLVVADA